ncbi:tyrosine-type recombinase/integrase [Bradyrhizobium diazoefficiens]|uniref:tyrosine-type recombinase/integrase n=1 Tax=Bradyrhizobium diazoefficiens TaxID=1355477 RepID=UPI00272B2463|nr:tyrosine-type recombinase/integrase [Bradyrhizobium diazoefficiens]WLA58524.1 tyrosine-type recombinase/integrase [Bradyrhizobium diazoefficiens]
MIKTRLKYCVFDPDPNGNPRYYVRKPGRPKIRIREAFEGADGTITPEFMKAYFDALAELDGARPVPKLPREKTFKWLVDQYLRSPEFARYDELTRADKRSVLIRYCETAGDLPYGAMRKEDVEASRDKRSSTPGAADKLVKYLRVMFKWAIGKKHAQHNPAIGVEKINSDSTGWHTWTPAEVDIYREHHKIGTKARLALELMLNVGARISDAARIGRQHEAEGWLKFVAWKNRNKKSRKTIECPITRDLTAALAATETGDLTYLVNDLGRAFTINGLGNKMRDWCDAAGLPQCSSHGLRKAAAVIMAENGSTAAEMCALFGWSKLETAEIYIREAQKRKMVANAFARLDEYRNRESVSVPRTKQPTETKRTKSRAKSKRK